MDWRGLLGFSAGAVLAALTPVLPGWPLIAGAALLAVVGLRWSALRPACLAVLGSCWFLAHAQLLVEGQWPDDRAGDEIRVAGTIEGVPESRGSGVRFVFKPEPGQAERLPSRILVDWYRPREYMRPGDRWDMTLRLDPPHGRLNVGAFDYHRYLLSRRIGALGRVSGPVDRLESSGWGSAVDRRRQYLAEVLQAETTRLDAAVLMRALGLADRGGLSPETRDLLRQTGTAHLLAISGLHVGLVAGMAGLLGGLLLAPLSLASGRLDRRRLALGAALLAATAYAMLAGFTLPTQRALIMLAVAGGAFLLRRGIQPAHALLLALVAVILFDPMAPLATGFWLSFAAVAILIWTFAWRPSAPQGVRGWVIGLARAQLIIAVGLLPLNVGVFQQFIPVALVANLVAIPIVGFVVLPMLLAGMAAVLLDWPAAWPLAVAEFGLVGVLEVLETLNRLEVGHFGWHGGGLPATGLALLGAAWLLAPRGWPARWLGLALFLPLLVPGSKPPQSDQLVVDVFDVGNGLAVIVEAGGERLLYDTGPGDGEGADAIGAILPGLLAERGGGGLDRIVVSHQHRGHAGGLGSVVDRVELDALYSPVDGLGRRCQPGDGWRAGAWQFEFLHPSRGLPYLDGNSSCVLRVSGPGGRLLLTGAIDADVERRLLRRPEDLPADVLVVSASGHRRASHSEFLEAVAPVLALISVARHDPFERPHPEVLERLEAADAEWRSTADCGALSVTLSAGRAPQLRSRSVQAPRFWRQRSACR